MLHIQLSIIQSGPSPLDACVVLKMDVFLIGLDAEEVGSGQMAQIMIAPAVALQSSRVVEIGA